MMRLRGHVPLSREDPLVRDTLSRADPPEDPAPVRRADLPQDPDTHSRAGLQADLR